MATKTKTDLRSVDLAGGKLVYDADMKMGVLRKLMKAGTSGDLDVMIEAYSGIITAWPYEGDPSDTESWDEIRKSEFAALNEALMQDLSDQGEE